MYAAWWLSTVASYAFCFNLFTQENSKPSDKDNIKSQDIKEDTKPQKKRKQAMPVNIALRSNAASWLKSACKNAFDKNQQQQLSSHGRTRMLEMHNMLVLSLLLLIFESKDELNSLGWIKDKILSNLLEIIRKHMKTLTTMKKHKLVCTKFEMLCTFHNTVIM